jgi:meiotically up-regulated gene 157 (Mug157) protein
MNKAKKAKIQTALTKTLQATLRLWDAEKELEELTGDLPEEWLGDYAAMFEDAETAQASPAHVDELLKAIRKG